MFGLLCPAVALLAWLALPITAAATPVHKCTVDGLVTYQRDPCPTSATGKRPTVQSLNAERQARQRPAGDDVVSRQRPVQPAATSFRCDGRKHCSQMTSCAEASFFLAHCPGVEMDGDRNGIPCERQWCSGR